MVWKGQGPFRSTWQMIEALTVMGRFWFEARGRGLLIQAALALAVVLALIGMVLTARENLARVNITAGFGFLAMPSGVQMGEALLPQGPQDSYGWMMLVAGANTLRVVLLACLLSTVLGLGVALVRLSSGLPRWLAAGYIALCRGTPVLLQILVWYAVLQGLPPIRRALSIGDSIFLSQRGLSLPRPVLAQPEWVAAGALILLAGLGLRLCVSPGAAPWLRLARRAAWPAAALGLLALLAGLQLETPIRRPFSFQGGLTLSPEFAALLCGLVFYSTAYIAEVIRGGILALPRGQWEAAGALGLKRWQALRLVVLPQALRSVIPPMTLQYISILKNSTLAFAIGYPDLFWSANTVINQTGHAVEGIALLMGAFLLPSLAAALALGALNRSLLRRGAR